MDAIEIKTKGKLVKSWKKMDGSWYEDTYRIYQLDGKFYQIKNHVCITSGGMMNYWDRVTEVSMEGPLPTHVAAIIGQSSMGELYISAQRQGTPEELTEWAVDYIAKSRGKNLTMKMMPLAF